MYIPAPFRPVHLSVCMSLSLSLCPSPLDSCLCVRASTRPSSCCACSLGWCVPASILPSRPSFFRTNVSTSCVSAYAVSLLLQTFLKLTVAVQPNYIWWGEQETPDLLSKIRMMVEQGKMDDDTAAFLLNDSKGAGSAGAAPSSSSVPGQKCWRGTRMTARGRNFMRTWRRS